MSVRYNWYGDLAVEIAKRGMTAGAEQAMQILLEASQQQVPLDTGALMESGHVEADDESAIVAYDTPYAVRWHEEQANFQNGRKNKYLEDPANDGGVQARMQDAIRSNFEF